MSIIYSIEYNSGKQTLTVPKKTQSASIWEGQLVFKSATGLGYEIANASTPAATRCFFVARDSPAGCPHLSVVLTGIVRGIFASAAALATYNSNLLSYTQTGFKPCTLTPSGLIDTAGTPNAYAVGQVRMQNGSRTLDVIKNYGVGTVNTSKENSIEKVTEPAVLALSPTAVYAYVLVR
jgi:hypothetical protein